MIRPLENIRADVKDIAAALRSIYRRHRDSIKSLIGR